jgi:hypothetical protein
VEYSPSTRHEFIADLTRGPDGWEIKRINIQPLTESVPS